MIARRGRTRRRSPPAPRDRRWGPRRLDRAGRCRPGARAGSLELELAAGPRSTSTTRSAAAIDVLDLGRRGEGLQRADLVPTSAGLANHDVRLAPSSGSQSSLAGWPSWRQLKHPAVAAVARTRAASSAATIAGLKVLVLAPRSRAYRDASTRVDALATTSIGAIVASRRPWPALYGGSGLAMEHLHLPQQAGISIGHKGEVLSGCRYLDLVSIRSWVIERARQRPGDSRLSTKTSAC